jgi:Asp-tRNA(Asn)/Glu-tRNA(Gln) amidotransferase A subunit family amidase
MGCGASSAATTPGQQPSPAVHVRQDMSESSSGRPAQEAQTAFHPSFPPAALLDSGDVVALGGWFDKEAPQTLFQPMADATPRELELYSMSAMDYVTARRSGTVTCLEFAKAMVRRLLHYKESNAFMLTTYSLTDAIVAQAAALDEKAASEGIESIGPLFGLVVPIKGTAATTDFPTSLGLGVLDRVYAAQDCDLVSRLREAGAVVMGKTNCCELASGWATINRTNGVAWNIYPSSTGPLTSGGSSGGSAVAVAAHIAPLAMTEDTGGSTRCPANQCGNFGYDPPRNKYPNNGNPGLTCYHDQTGVNTRNFEDVLLFDRVITGATAEHAAAAARVAAMETSKIRVGFPQEVFVAAQHPGGLLPRRRRERGLSQFQRRVECAGVVHNPRQAKNLCGRAQCCGV